MFRFLIQGVACAVAVCASTWAAQPMTGDLFVHDPSTILKLGSNYFLFNTGMGIATKSSSNRVHWTRGSPVFNAPPAWTTNTVPSFRGHFWAPDVIQLNGQYYLYYSVSTFGKQVSAIGLATSPTLDPAAPNYHWTDHGAVIQSTNGSPFNAIDPALFRDRDGKIWMAFGSFWRGIYLVELDSRTGKRVAPDSPFRRVAYHRDIEAAALHQREDRYYLFVNWGLCCRGTNSTYEVRVGRSKTITGPYLDRDGHDLVNGGGTLFLKTEGADFGPGHIAVLNDDGREFISCHVYDATLRGRSQLRLRALQWSEDGWPAAVQ
ncbi:MAG: arabinan endo-1,5-alpha-L-arabinosidase [Verrucomicrobia bacterium]|nr:arabinan endo-1,5-alpha-L-arabinosidase [Verrucomicrobiota bacterium]